jgi:hypothetical protein
MTVSEKFHQYSDIMFKYLFGSDVDNNGSKYSDIYRWELKGLNESFSGMCSSYKRHNYTINAESIVCWILCEFVDCFGDVCENKCYLCAYEMSQFIKECEY